MFFHLNNTAVIDARWGHLSPARMVMTCPGVSSNGSSNFMRALFLAVGSRCR